MTLCRFRYNHETRQFVCQTCGYSSPALAACSCPFKAKTRASDNAAGAWATCPHRGPAIATINARVAGCGCSSSVVEAFRCERFGEPVLIQAAPRCIREISAVARGYTGRTCRQCKIPAIVSTRPQPLPPARYGVLKSLAAVTCYFNPQRSRTRRTNWEQFAEHMRRQRIPLVTVESIRQGQTQELQGSLPITCRDTLWHKERLLNLGIESLPPDVDAVAWLDADVLFDRPDMRDAILDALSRWQVLQPWSECDLVGRDGAPQGWLKSPTARSLAAVNGGQPGDAHPHNKHPGFAWAARRDTLRAIGGLYDRHVTGGGDTAMAMGFYADTKSLFLNQDRMSDAMLTHWLQWADRAAAVVQGHVGYLDGMIRHLYHGELVDRQYLYRWTKLAAAGFDPGAHVAIGDSGALEWTAGAPNKLREYVADYLLRQRKEP